MSWSAFFTFGLGLVALVARTDALDVANYYSSGMVLQRGPTQANIWGTSSSTGGTVEVTVDGEAAGSGTVAGDGTWSVMLAAMDAGGPYTIGISADDGQVSLDDVYFGDVWICSGQSNMEFPFRQVDDFNSLHAQSLSFDKIRFMIVNRGTSGTEQTEPDISNAWQKPGNDGATEGVSGLCILFAMELSPSIGDIPQGLIDTTWGGTPVESWSSSAAMAACNTNFNYGSSAEQQHSSLWNAMVAPFTKMSIFGAIWYQGESNSEHADAYKCQFDAMIDDWRVEFNKNSGTSADFPFGFVQLAPWREGNYQSGFIDIRWEQTYEYGYVPNPDMPGVFMACAMDLPDVDSPYVGIHPRYKQDIAERLALAARGVAYGEDIVYNGPYPETITDNGNTITIDYGGNSVLDVRSNDGFEVCCSGSCDAYSFQAAPITSSDQTSVTIQSCSGQSASAVRYAWNETPCDFKKCAVYSQETDLPAPCFKEQGPF